MPLSIIVTDHSRIANLRHFRAVQLDRFLFHDTIQLRTRREVKLVNLSNPSAENMAFMIEEIKSKLRMASGAAMQASHYDLDRYEDIKDIYEMVVSKEKFSISEIEAIVSELGQLRKS